VRLQFSVIDRSVPKRFQEFSGPHHSDTVFLAQASGERRIAQVVVVRHNEWSMYCRTFSSGRRRRSLGPSATRSNSSNRASDQTRPKRFFRQAVNKGDSGTRQVEAILISSFVSMTASTLAPLLNLLSHLVHDGDQFFVAQLVYVFFGGRPLAGQRNEFVKRLLPLIWRDCLQARDLLFDRRQFLCHNHNLGAFRRRYTDPSNLTTLDYTLKRCRHIPPPAEKHNSFH